MFIYNILLNLMFFPVIVGLFLFSVFNIRLRRTILSRFGFFKLKSFKEQPVWFHCSSLGEFNAIKNVLIILKKHYKNIFITTLTDTGFTAAENFLGSGNVNILPLDFNFLIKRFIKKLNPRLLVIEETEVWPNLIYQAGKCNLPVIYTNCIISGKSFKFYNGLNFIFKQVLKNINVFFIQNKTTSRYLKKLKVPDEKINYIGNIKFDIKIPKNKNIKNIKQKFYLTGKLVITAGSTRENEEKILLNVYKKLKIKYKNLKLIIVPRHLNRVKEIVDLFKLNNVKYTLYSSIKKDYDVLLVNKMGILMDMYSVSNLSFIGGTLIPAGGHNPIEAACVKTPVIFGRYIKNNKEAFLKIMENKGGFIVQDERELLNQIEQLLKNKQKLKKIGLNAFKVIKNNQGASGKIVQYIVKNYLID